MDGFSYKSSLDDRPGSRAARRKVRLCERRIFLEARILSRVLSPTVFRVVLDETRRDFRLRPRNIYAVVNGVCPDTYILKFYGINDNSVMSYVAL